MNVLRKCLKELEKNRIKQTIFFLTSMMILSIGYVTCMEIMSRNFSIVEDNYTWTYQVDSINVKNEKLIITGWAFELKKDAKNGAFEIILHNAETGENIYPRMRYTSREDVNKYFLCEYDYTKSGFEVVISTDKYDFENEIYEIILKPTKTTKAFSTKIYCVDGKMQFVHPDEFIPLEVAGTEIEDIVTEGILRVYRPDFGMYVYQYNGELYWIAEQEYGFVNGDTYVQYQMNTTQIANLPQERIENNWLWDNSGFMFQKNELKDIDTGKYRVTKKAIPTKFSVTNIWTGNYIEGWIWIQHFHPWYEFD